MISRRWKPAVSSLLAVLLVTCVLTGIAEACPSCKDAIAGDAQRANLVRGYFWSILFMMSMPFLIFSGLGAYFFYLVRQGHAQRPQAPAAPAFHGHGPVGA